jgi:NAD(P)-dependent dehydrogenase (short-subunit alcohol dehydrogenase family)
MTRVSDHRLEGRTVVVTGAASGIGAAIARGVAASGATVACVDRDAAGVAATAEGLPSASHHALDLTDFAAVEQLGEDVRRMHGRVHGLVTAAGGSRGEARPFLEMDPATWHHMVDRNLTSTFHTALIFARMMAEDGGGSIVLVSSQLSVVVRPGLAHYGASKGAINQLVRGMAVDLGPHGIRVNAVAPGPTITPGNAAWFAQPEVERFHAEHIPLGRPAEPDEMWGSAVHLLSDESSFTTGAVLMVDGGYTLT